MNSTVRLSGLRTAPSAPAGVRRRCTGHSRRIRYLAGAGLFLAVSVAVVLPRIGFEYEDAATLAAELVDAGEAESSDPALERAITAARNRLVGLQSRRAYIVVDTANNRLYLRRGDELLRTAVCSSGSGYVLEDGPSGRTWTFDSPQGVFRVQTRLVDPVWRRPDWAFLEASEPVPTDPGKRLEYGVLGRYALYFGNGYMIHGTLYERLLGRSVTHGCIRLGRDDLAAVYAASPTGTNIYIY